MEIPCKRCGAVKTERIYGIEDQLARLFGYKARECGGCRRLRWIPLEPNGREAHPPARRRHRRRKEASVVSGSGAVAVAASPGRRSEGLPENSADDDPEPIRCPQCGTDRVRPSRRTFFERLLGKGKMMRCRKCGKRFCSEPEETYEDD